MPRPFLPLLHRLAWIWAGCLAASVCHAQAALPPTVAQALQRAEVPVSALHVVVQEAAGARTVLSLNADEPVNPASLVKLLTTTAALELLGPAYTWATPVWLAGTVREGVLEGSLHIRGTGDPKLVLERAWLLLRRVQAMGVREIRGDIVLDRAAFAPPEGGAGDFDGEPNRPYNVRPDALLLNFKAVTYSFTPDAAAGVARIAAEPALAGVSVQATVPLGAGACDDWRARLKPQFGDVQSVRFAGHYPASCGELAWPVADAEPASYNARLLAALWQDMGGRLTGTVREGPAPAGVKPTFEIKSPPLAELVRDINKFSNNVMAQQLFYSLALARGAPQPVTQELAREQLRAWLLQRLGGLPPGVVIDNGSGLSRESRLPASVLARMLQLNWASPVMSELMSSLPISGTDGTLRRMQATAGRAHLKTGSLRDVAGVAGYVLSNSGRRYVVVAIAQHARANEARPAIDALVQWVMRDAPAR